MTLPGAADRRVEPVQAHCQLSETVIAAIVIRQPGHHRLDVGIAQLSNTGFETIRIAPWP